MSMRPLPGRVRVTTSAAGMTAPTPAYKRSSRYISMRLMPEEENEQKSEAEEDAERNWELHAAIAFQRRRDGDDGAADRAEHQHRGNGAPSDDGAEHRQQFDVAEPHALDVPQQPVRADD